MNNHKPPINFNSKRAEAEEDNSLWTIQDMLEEAGEDAKKGDYNKAITIILNDNNESHIYDYRRFIVNMNYSEVIALLNILAIRLAREMGE